MPIVPIDLTDAQFSAFASGLPGEGKDEDRVTAYLQVQVDAISGQFVKRADDARFAAAGLPNLKEAGLDEAQQALVLADAAPKFAAKLAAAEAEKVLLAEASAKSLAGEAVRP